MLATDPVAAVLALWEAIEFYASRLAVPPLLSPEEAADVQTALARVALRPDQKQRADDCFARVNEAPLMARVRAALVTDRVPFNEKDLVVLGRLRKQRNDALHGRARGKPAVGDLDIARGLVNRMLVFWTAGPRPRRHTGGSGREGAAPDRYELEISGGAIQVTLDDDVPPAASVPVAAHKAGLRGSIGARAPSLTVASAESGSFALGLMLDGVERAISRVRRVT